MSKVVVAFGLLGLVFSGSARANFAYTGHLSSSGADPGLVVAGGAWLCGEVTVDWSVAKKSAEIWNYRYELNVPWVDVLCVIVEVSDGTKGPVFTDQNIFNWSSVPQDWISGAPIVGMHKSVDHVNLRPPGLYGAKFCGMQDPKTLEISFDSDRMPVWGDFYAMSIPTTMGFNTVYNKGFGWPVESDPDLPPHDGSEAYHILVPDSACVRIPAPGAVLLTGIGAILTRILRRRRCF